MGFNELGKKKHLDSMNTNGKEVNIVHVNGDGFLAFIASVGDFDSPQAFVRVFGCCPNEMKDSGGKPWSRMIEAVGVGYRKLRMHIKFRSLVVHPQSGLRNPWISEGHLGLARALWSSISDAWISEVKCCKAIRQPTGA